MRRSRLKLIDQYQCGPRCLFFKTPGAVERDTPVQKCQATRTNSTIEVPIDPPPPPPTPTSEPLKKVLGLLKHDQDEQKFVGLLR